MKRIFWVLMMIVAVAVAAAAWSIHRARARALEGGDVSVRDRNGGKTTLQQPPVTASGNQTPQAGNQSGTETGDNHAAATAHSGPLAPPASDSIRRSPPSGMVFAGAGKYQLYRQGDITWRLNTDNGDACILFATETQWRRPLVYNHGCGAS